MYSVSGAAAGAGSLKPMVDTPTAQRQSAQSGPIGYPRVYPL